MSEYRSQNLFRAACTDRLSHHDDMSCHTEVILSAALQFLLALEKSEEWKQEPL